MIAKALLVTTLVLLPLAAAAPEQVHVGLGDQDALAGYVVSWVDTDPTGPDLLTFHGPDGDVRVDAITVPGPTPGVVREARLPPLVPGANASYDIGERSFRLRVRPSEGALKIVALGDMGATREAGDAVETIARDLPDMVLHVGDVAYAGGDPITWKAWFDLVEPVASGTPWMPALGNHEGDVAGLTTESVTPEEKPAPDPSEQAVFKQRFPLPSETFWYSFDVAGVHFVALDTFSAVEMPAAEIEWLRQDLAAAKGAEWIIAYLHAPPYSSNGFHGSNPRAYDAFAKILEDAGVDLVLTGHDHFYERTFALRGGRVVSRANETTKGSGTVYVVTGGAGAGLYESLVDPQPEWSATRAAVHHILQLEITPDRIDARVVPTGASGLSDSFAIVRPSSVAAAPATAADAPFVPTLALLTAFALLAIVFGLRRRP